MPLISSDKDDLLVKCACHSHAIEFHYDDWDKDTVPTIDISIWSLGQRPYKLSWRHRLRWVWYLLKDGTLEGDDIIITEKDADEIVNFLKEKVVLIEQRLKEFDEKKNKKV